MCVLELLTLTVLRACQLLEALCSSHIAISAFAALIVLRACLLSEALGRSHIGILDFTTLTQLVGVDLRHSRTIRSSPIRAPLLTLVARPSPGGVHIDSTLSHFGISSGILPAPLPPPMLRFGRCPRPFKAPIDRTMISGHFGLQRDSGLIWGPGPVWACFWPVSPAY